MAFGVLLANVHTPVWKAGVEEAARLAPEVCERIAGDGQEASLVQLQGLQARVSKGCLTCGCLHAATMLDAVLGTSPNWVGQLRNVCAQTRRFLTCSLPTREAL